MIVESSLAHSYAPKGPWSLRSEAGAAASCTESARIQLGVKTVFGPRCRLSLGPGFRLGARWNRLGETVRTRKKREKADQTWARYGLTINSVKDLLVAGGGQLVGGRLLRRARQRLPPLLW